MTAMSIARLHDAQMLAALHARAFDDAWSAESFADLLAGRGVSAWGHEHGFILLRRVLDETEILTLAIAPDRRRQGFAKALLAQACLEMRRDLAAGEKAVLHLEVGIGNHAALALYREFGFVETGQRPNYYQGETALLMQFSVFSQ